MKPVIETSGTDMTVFLPAELDHPASDIIRRETDRIMGKIYIRTIIFDFAQTKFMDSSGIGLIMGRCQQMQARSGNVIIQNPPPHIRRVMRLSGMERIASIEITNI